MKLFQLIDRDGEQIGLITARWVDGYEGTSAVLEDDVWNLANELYESSTHFYEDLEEKAAEMDIIIERVFTEELILT